MRWYRVCDRERPQSAEPARASAGGQGVAAAALAARDSLAIWTLYSDGIAAAGDARDRQRAPDGEGE